MAKQPAKIGFWTMVRDVLIASMNKGQFPLAMVGMIVLTIIFKMPAEDVSRLAFQIITDLKAGYLLGYVLSIGSVSGWFIHARWQRRSITVEIDRLSGDRTRTQKQQLGTGKVKSSRS